VKLLFAQSNKNLKNKKFHCWRRERLVCIHQSQGKLYPALEFEAADSNRRGWGKWKSVEDNTSSKEKNDQNMRTPWKTNSRNFILNHYKAQDQVFSNYTWMMIYKFLFKSKIIEHLSSPFFSNVFYPTFKLIKI
jgi:hypothetical protein